MNYKFEVNNNGRVNLEFKGDLGDAAAILALQFNYFYKTMTEDESERTKIAKALLTGVLLEIRDKKIETQLFDALKELYERMCEDDDLCHGKKN